MIDILLQLKVEPETDPMEIDWDALLNLPRGSVSVLYVDSSEIQELAHPCATGCKSTDGLCRTIAECKL